MGCWCLLTYSIMSAISAGMRTQNLKKKFSLNNNEAMIFDSIVILEKFLMDRFSTRTLYFFSYLVYAICCGAIYFQTNVYIIMPLSSSLGILLTAICTLPYQMLSEFHKDNKYRNKSASGTKRGLGNYKNDQKILYFIFDIF